VTFDETFTWYGSLLVRCSVLLIVLPVNWWLHSEHLLIRKSHFVNGLVASLTQQRHAAFNISRDQNQTAGAPSCVWRHEVAELSWRFVAQNCGKFLSTFQYLWDICWTQDCLSDCIGLVGLCCKP